VRSDRLQRDITIDIVRGAGILMIGVDHLAYLAEKFGTANFVNPFITWLRVGWSSAAEFFVFFSGYLTGMVYLKTLHTHGTWMMWARAAQRSWHIYVVNLLTLCCVLVLLHLAPFANGQLNTLTDMQTLMGADAARGIVEFLRLQFSPLFFEILNLYIVLLLVAPAVILLAQVSRAAVILISVGIWLVVQLNAAWGIAPAFASDSNFNPLGWQLVFVLGMLAGMHGVFARLRELWSRRRLVLVSGSLLLVAFVIKMIDRSGWALPLIGAFDMPGFDKVNLGSLQLAHFLVSVVFVTQIIPRSLTIQGSLPFRAVAGVGRRSLECFCLSTILVYAGVGLLSQTGSFDPLSLLVVGAVIVLCLCAFAPLVEWIEARPWRVQSAGLQPEARSTTDSRPVSAALTMRNVP